MNQSNMILRESPLRDMDTTFLGYLAQKKRQVDLHMDGNGLPDYAFSLDYELRKKLDSIPHFYDITRKVVGTYVSRQVEIFNQQALAVGPQQFPEVYAIGRDCAKRLGIGAPNIFILGTTEINAFTLAADDLEPIIVIYSGLLERVTEGELRFIIGHECGHIHNQHSLYDTMAQIMLSGGASALSGFGLGSLVRTVLQGATYALRAWSRAMEVSADRAGIICSDRIEDAYNALAKLMYGGAFGEHEVNLNEILKQLERQQNSLARLEELLGDHPAIARRIAAGMAFSECDLLYDWCPDKRTPGQALKSKEEVDARCREVINIILKRGEKA